MATQTSRSMISETSICNQALSWLGAEPIESLEEPTVAGQFCRENYPFIRDAVLEERMWTFALARAESTSADLSAWGSQYLHPKPLDWLNVYRVYSNAGGTIEADWQREGENIVADEATVYMWGVKRITDTGKFSNMFVQCVAARLASELAIPLTENAELQATMWALYGDKLREASRTDRQGRNDFVNDICEQALVLLGADRVYNGAEQNVVSERLRASYEPSRNALLAERLWSFAIARATNTSTTAGPWAQGYEHDIPAGWLGVFRVWADATATCKANWTREGAKIMTDESTVYMWGTQIVTDSSLYPPLFTQALVARLAMDMALSITESRPIFENMVQLYNQRLADAAAIDGMQGVNEGINQTILTGARVNGGSALLGGR